MVWGRSGGGGSLVFDDFSLEKSVFGQQERWYVCVGETGRVCVSECVRGHVRARHICNWLSLPRSQPSL